MPTVPLSQAGVAPEFIRGTTQVGSGPQARAFARTSNLDYGAFPPELTTPIEDPNVPQDFTSILNHYYPYDAPPPVVPPNPRTDLFVPTARIDGPLGAGSIDDRRRQAPAGRMLYDREQKSRGPGPKPSYSLMSEPGPVVADQVNGQLIIRDPDNPNYQGYVPPAAPAAPQVPLSSVYGPLARAYQKSGPQDFTLGDVNVENPYIANPVPGLARGAFNNDADFQEYLRTGDWRNADPAVVERARNGGGDPLAGVGGINVRDIVLGQNPFGRVIGAAPEKIARAIGGGQSILDIITVHADALIPGPGQGTLKKRFDQYVAQGLAPDQAANKTMSDYGDALAKFAETPSAPGDVGSVAARGGAQAARILGLIQSITAPAPGPGGTSVPFVAGFIRSGSKKAATSLGEELAAKVAKGELTESFAARLLSGADISKVPAAERLASEAANPSVIGVERAAIAEAARNVRNAATTITTKEGTGALGGAATKADIRKAEDRLVELNRERAAQGKPALNELPPTTYGGGGNDPTRGFQIEKYPAEVQPFMREVAKQLDPLLAGTTGRLTHEDITLASQMTGETIKETTKRLAKRGTSSVDIQAVRIGIAAKTKIAQDLATQVAKGNRDPKLVYDALSSLQEAATIQGALHEAASEAGRTLGVLRSQIDPSLATNSTSMAFLAAISRIARSPEHAQVIMDGLLQIGDDPQKVYKLLRGLNSPNWVEKVSEVINIPRGLRASFDVSFTGRQGIILSIADPKAGAASLRAQFDALRSDAVAQSIERASTTSPMFPIRQKAGVFHAQWGYSARITDREEAVISLGLLGNLPGIAGRGYRASDRAFAIAGNTLRDTHFDNVMMGWQRADPRIPISDYRAQLLASWVNIASGRGDLPGFLAQSMPLLAGILFSPRFAASRFQAFTYAPTQALKAGARAGRTAIGKGAEGDLSKAADELAMAKVAAGDMVKYVSGNLIFMAAMKAAALASGADVKIETDPISPEFGKMRFGGTVVDMWGGEQQVLRNVAQFYTGQKKTVTGKNVGQIVEVPRDEVFGRFIRSKLSPSASLGYDWMVGAGKKERQAAIDAGKPMWDMPFAEDFVGQAYTPKDLVTSTGSSLFLPMSWSDIIDAVQADRAEGGSGLRGLILGSTSLLGVGVTTYGSEDTGGQRATPRGSGIGGIDPYH